MQNPLFGRRIHITGSIDKDPSVASAENVEATREFITELVTQLMQKGATFVVPVDAEPLRNSDNFPICFDWLVWETINSNLAKRHSGFPMPLAIAVQHHKTEEQIPEEFQDLWDGLRESDFIKIENAAEWNMASKRMEAQARWGDILIAVGGDEGVLYLANLYHEAGKPVIPLNFPLCEQGKGARKLFSYGLNSSITKRLFNTGGAKDAHTWLNLINFPKRKPTSERVPIFIDLLESLNRPKAFAVRLLNPDHSDFVDVENFFETVVDPVISQELGYELVTIGSKHVYESASVVQDIFSNLHKSSIVISDITGERPNCFIELGYAFGRNVPTILTAKKGTSHPFDVSVFSGHHWEAEGSVDNKRKRFREHLEAIKNRAPLVPMEPLIA